MKTLLLVLFVLIDAAKGQTDQFIYTETVTESRDFATSTLTTIAATKTVYLIPRKSRPWWSWYKKGDQGQEKHDGQTVTETSIQYIFVTVTNSCPQTAAPTTISSPLTITVTKYNVQWKTVPVAIKYYSTLTMTTTARPLIADLLPKLASALPTTQPSRQSSTQGYQLGGQLAKDLLSPKTSLRSTKTTTVLSTITPSCDWKELPTATLNACDLCRQNCKDLSGNCCVAECMEEVPVPPPVPPINPDAIPCDDPAMK